MLTSPPHAAPLSARPLPTRDDAARRVSRAPRARSGSTRSLVVAVLGLLVATMGWALPTFASAQDSGSAGARGGDAWVNRGLVQPARQLQVLSGTSSGQSLSLPWPLTPGVGGYGLQVYRFGVRYTIDTPVSTTTVRFNDIRTSWPVGFSYAPVDNLEIGLGAHADNVPVWLTYRFLDGDFQMGARFAVYIPIDGTVGLQFGLPMQVRAGRILRLDTGMFVTAFFPEGNDAVVSMHAPLRFGFQLSDVVYAGVQSGVYIPDFDGVEVPLMGFVGFTARTGPGPIDIGFRFGFDRFFWAGEALDQAALRPGGPRNAGVDVNDFSFAIGFDIAVQY